MAKEDPVLMTVTIEIKQSDIQAIIDVLNEYEVYEEEGDEKLTLEELQEKPELLKYLVNELDFKDSLMSDLEEFWNGDGWSEWRTFR